MAATRERLKEALAQLDPDGSDSVAVASFRKLLDSIGVAAPDVEAWLETLPAHVHHESGGLCISALAEHLFCHPKCQLQAWKEAAAAQLAGAAAPGSESPVVTGPARPWTFVDWLFRSLGFAQTLAQRVEAHVAGADAGTGAEALLLEFVRKTQDCGSREALRELVQECGAADLLVDALWEGGRELGPGTPASARELHEHFLQGAANFELSFGPAADFAGGLEMLIGAPDPRLRRGMWREHCSMADADVPFTAGAYGITTTPRKEWAFMTGGQPPSGGWPQETKNCKDADRRQPRPRSWLMHEMGQVNAVLKKHAEPELVEEEAIALRLSTGPMGDVYNAVLRGMAQRKECESIRRDLGKLSAGLLAVEDAEKAEYREKLEVALQKAEAGVQRFEVIKGSTNSYATTIHLMNSGLLKLSKIQKPVKVYRGISGGLLPEGFWVPDASGVCGGVDKAFLCTTSDRKVALAFACGDPQKCSTVLEVQTSMVDRVANLQWVSQYPHEAELTFPPLTMLEVSTIRAEKDVLVVECVAHTQTVTIEYTLDRNLNALERVYSHLEHLLGILQRRDALVVRGSWLTDPQCPLERLEKRQDLEALQAQGSHVFWDADELREHMDRTEIVVVSYCWLSAEHPDPSGQHLARLRRALKLRLLSTGADQVDDVAIFVDFMCLHQGVRTHSENAAFKRALKSINIWYAHQSTTVWINSYIPEDVEAPQYHERGWPVFEHAVSQLIKDERRLVDLRCLDAEEASSCTDWWSISKLGRVGRRPPLLPEQFAVDVEELKFTNGADKDFVRKKYEQTFDEVLGFVSSLHFHQVAWSDDQAKDLVGALGDCARLRVLSLRHNTIKAAGAKSLVQALNRLPTVRRLDLQGNPIEDDDLVELRQLWDSAPPQEARQLHCRVFSDDDVRHVAGCPGLLHVDFSGCRGITDRAAELVAELCKGIETVRMSGCAKLTDAGVACLARSFAGLQVADFSQCTGLADRAAEALAASCPSLRHVDLAGCGELTDAGVGALTEGCTGLVHAEFSGCGRLTDATVRAFGESCQSLEYLGLRDCENITEDALRLLGESLPTCEVAR